MILNPKLSRDFLLPGSVTEYNKDTNLKASVRVISKLKKNIQLPPIHYVIFTESINKNKKIIKKKSVTNEICRNEEIKNSLAVVKKNWIKYFFFFILIIMLLLIIILLTIIAINIIQFKNGNVYTL